MAAGMPACGPPVFDGQLFVHDSAFRDWLLTKLLNALSAAAKVW